MMNTYCQYYGPVVQIAFAYDDIADRDIRIRRGY